MDSHQAIKKMVGGHYREMARRLGLSKEMVYKWSEPMDDFSVSGAYNPLDRVEAMIDEAKRLGTPLVDAMAPIHYLATRFHGHFLPPVPQGVKLLTVSRQLATAMKEVSRAFAVSAAALEDERVTPNERRVMLDAAYVGLHELTMLIHLIEGDAA